MSRRRTRVRLLAVGALLVAAIAAGLLVVRPDPIGAGVLLVGGPPVAELRGTTPVAISAELAREDQRMLAAHHRFLEATRDVVPENQIETSMGSHAPLQITVSEHVSREQFATLRRAADAEKIPYVIRTATPQHFEVSQL